MSFQALLKILPHGQLTIMMNINGTQNEILYRTCYYYVRKNKSKDQNHDRNMIVISCVPVLLTKHSLQYNSFYDHADKMTVYEIKKILLCYLIHIKHNFILERSHREVFL